MQHNETVAAATASVTVVTHRGQSAGEASREPGVATVAAKGPLGVEFIELMSLVAVQGAGQADARWLTVGAHACPTCVQSLTTHISLKMRVYCDHY